MAGLTHLHALYIAHHDIKPETCCWIPSIAEGIVQSFHILASRVSLPFRMHALLVLALLTIWHRKYGAQHAVENLGMERCVAFGPSGCLYTSLSRLSLLTTHDPPSRCTLGDAPVLEVTEWYGLSIEARQCLVFVLARRPHERPSSTSIFERVKTLSR